jgi:glycosidase
MTDGKIPIIRALDPIPREFRFIPQHVFDLLGITINRDEVRTPMQWDTSRNAGFSSAETTWLPVNADYQSVNIETEASATFSPLNTIRELQKIRKQYPVLESGLLELMINDKVPDHVLMFRRTSGKHEILVVLNFHKKECRFDFIGNKWIKSFGLNPDDNVGVGTIKLKGFGGMVLSKIV